jgi:diaminopimelate decarboxylase
VITDAAAPLDLRLLPAGARADAGGRLSIGGVDVADLADVYGTPLYVYDEDEIRLRCRAYREAFGATDGSPGASYAAKAFLCTAMAHLVADEGLGLDVATGGEMHAAYRAGFPPARPRKLSRRCARLSLIKKLAGMTKSSSSRS